MAASKAAPMRSSWVIYVCRGCGEGVADGQTAHPADCRGGGFEEVVVVRKPLTRAQVYERSEEFLRRPVVTFPEEAPGA